MLKTAEEMSKVLRFWEEIAQMAYEFDVKAVRVYIDEMVSKLPESRMDEPPSSETRTLPYEDWMVIEGALCRIRDETLSTSELKLVTETLSRFREAKP